MPKKEKQGVVVSNKMEKTAVVKVASYNQHPKYKKIIETTKNYKAHDELNQCSEDYPIWLSWKLDGCTLVLTYDK